MKIQFMLISLLAIILIAVSAYGLASADDTLPLEYDDPIQGRNADASDNNTNTDFSISMITTAPPESKTLADITTANATANEISIPTTQSPTATTNPIPESTATSETFTNSSTAAEAPTTSTIITQAPTTQAPGRKFDGLSFLGGMILAVGLGALVYLVFNYLRRSNRLPYSNLR